MQLTSNQGDVFDVSGKETYAPGKGYHGSSKFSEIASGLTLIMPTQSLPARSRTKLWACRRSNLRIAYQTSQRYLIRRNRPCTTGILSSASVTILWGDYNRKVPPICSSYCSELLGQLSDTLSLNLQQISHVTSISSVDGRSLCKKLSALGATLHHQRVLCRAMDSTFPAHYSSIGSRKYRQGGVTH